MEKAAYLDAMGIARWREVGKPAPLSPELKQAINNMFDHPLFAELECQVKESFIALTPCSGESRSVSLGQLDTPQGKRALWHALSTCGAL
ncbi:hypothetical protein SHAM105786_11650 [Shewanella amazonensis]|uniref:Uncharacterized protein n=1 Tax=Shewanella amazonensis (strain ATCC BAA-1098 / SB2B) TaxID=326297 RepID=A1S8U3_SHEAM|nr:hypothetical protein [Shewanella amazonensis]ABM00800.1 hypothetical protein Sama_2597 [Shewanella amazonensis SB2B]